MGNSRSIQVKYLFIIAGRLTGLCRYKPLARQWAGLPVDGSEGTPLLAELGAGSLGAAAEKDRVEGIVQQVEQQAESVKTDSNNEGRLENLGTNKIRNETVSNVMEEQINYSQIEEVIEIDDSDDENNYEASQTLNHDNPEESMSKVFDFIDLENENFLPRSPSESDDRYSDIEEYIDDSDSPVDDDEIEILNESQNSLYKRIARVHNLKTEPDLQPSAESQINKVPEPIVPDCNEFEFEESQSLLGNEEEDECVLNQESVEKDLIHGDVHSDRHLESTEKNIINSQNGKYPNIAEMKKVDVKHKEKDLVYDITKMVDVDQETVRAILFKMEKETGVKTTDYEDHNELIINVIREIQTKMDDEGKRDFKDEDKVNIDFLADTLDIPIEKAEKLYIRSGNDMENACDLFLQNENKPQHRTNTNLLPKVTIQEDAESRDIDNSEPSSPDEDNINDLLCDSEDECERQTNTVIKSKERSKPIEPLNARESVKEKTKTVGQSGSKTKVIDPLPLTNRRGWGKLSTGGMKPKEDESIKNMETIGSKSQSKTGKVLRTGVDTFIYNVQSREEREELKKIKLREIAAKQTSSKTLTAKSDAAVKVKSSIPKNKQLLMELQKEETAKSSNKQRHPSDPSSPIVLDRPGIQKRRNSAAPVSSFLADVAAKENEKKSHKYVKTTDGYKVPKKMSVSNVSYNLFSQDISKKDILNVKPLNYEGIKPKKRPTETKHVHWRDEDVTKNLVDITEIPADNKGRKAGPGNKDLELNFNELKEKPTVTMTEIFNVILGWQPRWLEEQRSRTEPPNVAGKWGKPLPLPSSFRNHDDYIKLFLPLMFHQTWSSVSEDFLQKVDEKGRWQEDSFAVCVQEVTTDEKGKFNIIRCLGLLSDKEVNRRDLGQEGTLVQLDLSYKRPESGATGRTITPKLAFVQQTEKKYLDKRNSEADTERLELLTKAAVKANKKPKYVVSFTMKLKNVHLPADDKVLDLKRPIFMKVISRIKCDLKQYEALLNLAKTSIGECIFKPTNKAFNVPLGTENLHASIKDVPLLSTLNSNQKRSIVSLSRACLEASAAKICLLQGPPGTGKSTTITGLVLQILFTGLNRSKDNTMPRVLVVAPSNAAVDELVVKLARTTDHFKKKKPKILRIGIGSSMKAEARKYSFDSIVRDGMKRKQREMNQVDMYEKDVRQKQSAVNCLQDDINSAEEVGDTELAAKYKRDMKERIQAIKKLKAAMDKPLSGRAERELRREVEDRTMAGADVILTTLASSQSRDMTR